MTKPYPYGVEELEETIREFPSDQQQCLDGYADVQWIFDSVNSNVLETGNRAYQREKVATLEWKQNLISTLLGVDNTVAKIPEIHIRVKPTKADTIKYELVDGQQRTTTILDFINNKFPLPDELTGRFVDWSGMYFKDIEDHGKAGAKLCRFIKEYTISCKWYVNLSDLQIAHLFIEILNNTNDLKPQEKRNAVLGAFSTWVRDTARDGGATKPHPLFKRVQENGDDPVLKYFSKSFKMGRLQVDEWLSELVYLKMNGVEKGVNQKKHTAWVKEMQGTNGDYTNTFIHKDIMDDLLKLAHKIMDVAVSNDYRNRLNAMTTQMMVLYADKLQKKHGKLDINEYVTSFFNTYDDWCCMTKKLFAKETLLTGVQMPQFKALFGGKNANAIGSIFYVLDKEVDKGRYSFGITSKAKKRVFPKEMIEKKWRAQGKRCYYTDTPIALKDAVGDHFVPWTNGGETVWDNLVVTNKYHNSRKGDMSGTEYQTLLEQDNIKAVMQ